MPCVPTRWAWKRRPRATGSPRNRISAWRSISIRSSRWPTSASPECLQRPPTTLRRCRICRRHRSTHRACRRATGSTLPHGRTNSRTVRPLWEDGSSCCVCIPTPSPDTAMHSGTCSRPTGSPTHCRMRSPPIPRRIRIARSPSTISAASIWCRESCSRPRHSSPGLRCSTRADPAGAWPMCWRSRASMPRPRCGCAPFPRATMRMTTWCRAWI